MSCSGMSFRRPDMTEIISIDSSEKGGRWTPQVKGETLGLLERLRLPDGGHSLRNKAVEILSRCVPPTDSANQDTGLVVGYVQSGKTLSFTTVAALARDNGYQLIVVVAGTSVPLFRQSDARLQKDLQIDGKGYQKWLPLDNPKKGKAGIIRGALDGWKDKTLPPAAHRTVLITVMKNARHLDNLIELLDELDLSHVPTLIIDDEADQAGMNTLASQGKRSAIYSRLLSIKAATPHHSFLQYTATPQAPLLINLIDVLSPRFADVLTPGPDYVGGKEFFIERRDLLETINDLPDPATRSRRPPDSLLKALRYFIIGAADGFLKEDPDHRSMLVHPSQLTAKHTQYYAWVTAVKKEWLSILKLPDTSKEKQQLLEGFRATHSLLKATAPDLLPFDRFPSMLRHILATTNIVEMNSVAGTKSLRWNQSYSHILVGGQAMDRGFTVEGLTVTYMPRGLGVGQVDTLQQRARFFGYKRKFIGLCRVFLEEATISAYTKYVQHEEHMRKQLVEHTKTGKSLTEWKRVLLLERKLKPTRQSVLGLDYMRGQYSNRWIHPSAPHFPSALDANRAVCSEFLSSLQLKQDDGHPDRTRNQIHAVAAGLPLFHVHERLLSRLKFPHASDSSKMLGLLLQLQAHLEEHPGSTCSFYQMSPGEPRKRKLYARGEIENIFQGEYPVKLPERGRIYPGDRFVGNSSEVRIQLHNLALTRGDRVVHENIPTVAVWVPEPTGTGWLVEKRKSA